MPGLVRNHERALRLNASPFMQQVKAQIDKAAVVVLADGWLAGAVGSKKGCIRRPENIKGLKVRSAAPIGRRCRNAISTNASTRPLRLARPALSSTSALTVVFIAGGYHAATAVKFVDRMQKAAGSLHHPDDASKRQRLPTSCWR
jgi:hypothetical protein